MSSGSGKLKAYSVEARSVYTEPQFFDGKIFDERWREIHFAQSITCGVPRGPAWSILWLQACGLYSYAAAQALRWWFHANSEHLLCLETRIVEHDITYSYDSQRLSEHGVIKGEDRSSIMPNWSDKSVERKP
jgi:hypothetical protein